MKNLRDFAIKHARSTIPELKQWVQENAETAANLLFQVAFGFRPRQHPAKTVIPRVARAQLAATPLPGWLWDDVLEPLLAMAEGAAGDPADERLEEAIRRLCEVTRHSDAAAAVICGVRAAQAMEPLMELTEVGVYEAASETMAQAFLALRAAYDDHRERDRDLLESCTDHTAWIGRFSTRLLSNLNTLLEIRELAGNPQTDSELLAQLRKIKSAVKDERETLAKLRDLAELPEQGLSAPFANMAIVARAGVAWRALRRLVRNARLHDDAAADDPNDPDAWEAMVSVAVEAVRAQLWLSRGYDLGFDQAHWMGIADDCLRNRRLVPALRAELEAAEKQLRAGGVASSAAAFGKEGRLESQPVPGIPDRMGEFVSREIEQQEVGDAATSTFSAELEAFREGSYRTQLVAWMEERRMAIVFEMAGGREQAAAPSACAGSDAAKAIEQARPWCGVKVSDAAGVYDVLQDGPGDEYWHHAAAALEAVPELVHQVTRLQKELANARADDDATVRVWDEHSDAICAALGPYYSDPDGGYDYDAMVTGIEKLRKYAESLTDGLFRLVTVVRDGGTPARIAAAGVLSPATWAGKLDNALKLADAALSSRDVTQQTPDPAQGCVTRGNLTGQCTR